MDGTRPEDAAIIVYTSGTTGQPKGAMISHRNMVAMVRGLSQVITFRPKDSFVSALPLCHIAERMFSLIFPMWAGCTVNFAESVATLQDDLTEISPTAFSECAPYLGKNALQRYDKNARLYFLQALDLQSDATR